MTRLVHRRLSFLRLPIRLRRHVAERLRRDHYAILRVSLIRYEVLLDLHRVDRVFVVVESAYVVIRGNVLQNVLSPLRIVRHVGEGLINLRWLILL